MTTEPSLGGHSANQGRAPRLPADLFRNRVFRGPNGIRAGWRLLIFIALFLAFAYGIGSIPLIRHVLRAAEFSGAITPAALILAEGLNVVAVVLAAAVMTSIENRSFPDYGLPLNPFFHKSFWLGLLEGFLALTLLIGLIAARHGYSAGGLALASRDAVKYGLLYAVAFLLVALFEEFSFRGYLQSTLASGIGFWPAAVLLAIIFGAVHLRNPGEAQIGALAAGTFGLVAALSLRRTGNLWFAIGLHAAWDWGQTFFYSVPDSGLLAHGHLLDASFRGPNWLTGGSIGPEGSLLVFPVLLLLALAIHFLFPQRQRFS